MPRRGRPPKPVELKRRLGNPGKRPLPAPIIALTPSAPAAERPRFESGAALLQHVLDNGGSAWIGPTDVAADVLMIIYDDWLDARARWRGSRLRADYRVYDALTGRLMAFLSDLGLDPVSRSRLGLAEVKAMSGLTELREERVRNSCHDLCHSGSPTRR